MSEEKAKYQTNDQLEMKTRYGTLEMLVRGEMAYLIAVRQFTNIPALIELNRVEAEELRDMLEVFLTK